MNAKNLEITIPAEIVALPLAISEKVVLAQIHKVPDCSNASLATLIGGTCRGAENLLRRLRQCGYIEQTGKGRARRHYLLFPVERHTLGGDGDIAASNVESHTSCVDQPDESSVHLQNDSPVLRRELSLEDDLDQTLAIIHEMWFHQDSFPEEIVHLYGRILGRLIAKAPECPAKDALVGKLTKCRDTFVAISFGVRLPKKYHRQAARLISAAKPEKLAEFRRSVETGQFDQNVPLTLAALANDVNV
jgi:hypothetical protein